MQTLCESSRAHLRFPALPTPNHMGSPKEKSEEWPQEQGEGVLGQEAKRCDYIHPLGLQRSEYEREKKTDWHRARLKGKVGKARTDLLT